jgi:hypothetical protein
MTHPHTNHNLERTKIPTQNRKSGKTQAHTNTHTDLKHTRDNKTTQRFGNRFCFRLQVKICKEDESVGQWAGCLGTKTRLALMTRCLLFQNVALWSLLGIIPARTTDLPIFDVETFISIIIRLLFLGNINVFSLFGPIPTSKNRSRRSRSLFTAD